MRVTDTQRSWILLAIAIVLLNAGNLVLETSYKGRALSLDMFFELGFFASLALLGASFVFYSRALAILPLAVAYPVMVGISLVFVGIAGYVWLGTDLDLLQVAGMAVIFVGVTLISKKPKSSAEEVLK